MKRLITNPMQIRKEIALIEKEAKQLSGYTDQDYGYSGEDYGYNDDDDDEAGAAGRDKKKKGNVNRLLDFKLRIANRGSAAVDRTLALYSPFGYTVAQLASAGHTVAGIVQDGQIVSGATVGTNDVVGTAMRANRPISLLAQYALHNDLRLIGMTISSNDTAAFETDLQIVKLNPFKQEEESTIDLYNYYSEDNLTGKKIEADFINDGLDFTLDKETLVKMLVLANTTMTITLRFGGVNNQSAKFDKRASSAGNRMAERFMARGSKRR